MPKKDAELDVQDTNPMKAFLAPLDLEPLIAANQRAFQAAAEAQNHMMKRLVSMNHELFGFVARRLSHDRQVAKDLSRCQTPEDAVAVYAKFTETAMKDYSEELGVLAGAYATQAQEAMQDVQHQVESTIEAATAKDT